MLKQINIENQTINFLSEEELSKKIDVVGKKTVILYLVGTGNKR